jgi:GT2 family glycosyltransferase
MEHSSLISKLSKQTGEERQVALETAIARLENRVLRLEADNTALAHELAARRSALGALKTKARHVLGKLPGGPQLINLYATWNAPAVSGLAVSADIPLALVELAKDRNGALFSDWHVGLVRAARGMIADDQLVPITVAVVLHNSSRWLPGFTSALLRSNYPLNKVDVIFVDNESTDGTPDRVDDWIADQGRHLRKATLLRRKNDGYGAGNDAALTLSETEFVLVTNVDVEFDSNMLRRMVGTAVSDSPQIGCWEAMQIPFEHPKYYDPVTLLTNWSSHACVLLRRAAYYACGGYEKRLFMYGEDVELSYRLRASGWGLRYVPSARIVHHTEIDNQKFRPLQLSGSVAANVLLRHRYGRSVDSFVGEALLRWLRVTTHDEPRRNAINSAIQTVRRNRRAFWRTKRTGKAWFPFNGLDYDIVRDGAMFRRTIDLDVASLPSVSIVTRTMPGRYWRLIEAIASVLTQTYPNIQHVVIEDQGDGAQEIVDRVRELYGANICFGRSSTGGRTAVGNAGLKMATGDFILFLDDDDLLFPDHVETLVQTLINNPTSIGSYSLAWLVRTQVDDEAKTYHEHSHEVVPSHRLPYERRRLLIENIASIQSFLFRRIAYEKCGGFHEDLDLLEDWNLWCRYSSLGDFAFCEKLTSLYRVPTDVHSNAARQQSFDQSYEVVRARNLQDILANELPDYPDNSATPGVQ